MDSILNAGDLSSDQLRVVAFLQEDWRKQYRVTTVEQGIKASGFPAAREMRLRISEYLRSVYEQDPDFSKRLKEWGPESFMLTNSEKRVAKCILLVLRDSGNFPSEVSIANLVALAEEQVEAALDTLFQVGFLTRQADNGLIYALSAGHAQFLQGLGLTFHTLFLENGEEFNAQCAADALILAGGDYADQYVLIQDSCFHCLEPLEIRIQKGQVISQSPAGIRLFEGDG